MARLDYSYTPFLMIRSFAAVLAILSTSVLSATADAAPNRDVAVNQHLLSRLAIIQISAGNQHTCTLTALGGVKCWEQNRWADLAMAQVNTASLQ